MTAVDAAATLNKPPHSQQLVALIGDSEVVSN